MSLIKKIRDIYATVAEATSLHAESPHPFSEDALRELVSALTDCTQFMLKFSKSTFLGRGLPSGSLRMQFF